MKRLLPGVLLLVGSTALALFLAEVAIRLIAPQQLILIRPDMWQPADTIGWLHRSNVRTAVNTGEGTVRFFTDSAGFRVGQRGRIEGGRQILLLGDSFVEALQVNYEESVAGLLEVGLSHLLGDSVVVRNAGVGGWNPNHYLIRARSLLNDEYALVIVALFVDNDVVDERVEYFPPRPPVTRATLRWPRSLKWREIVQAWLSPLNDYLEVRSHFYVLVRSRLEIVRIRTGLMPRYFPFVLLRRHASSPFWDVTADLATDIAGLATESRVPVLFVIIPAPYQVQPEALGRLMKGFRLTPSDVDVEQPSRLLRESLQERGLPVVEALPRFREAYSGGFQLYGDVDPHLTRAGHKVLASLLMPTVLRCFAEKSCPEAVSPSSNTTTSSCIQDQQPAADSGCPARSSDELIRRHGLMHHPTQKATPGHTNGQPQILAPPTRTHSRKYRHKSEGDGDDTDTEQRRAARSTPESERHHKEGHPQDAEERPEPDGEPVREQ